MKPAIRSYLPVVSLIVFICVCLIAPPWAGAQNPENPQGNPPNVAAPAPAVANGNQLVSIDFNNVEIGVFIKFISDLTKMNFIVDEKVRGKVTIISPGKITVAEAYKVFESVLEVNGFATVPSGEITKIVPSPDARGKSIRTRLKEETGSVDDSIVTQIIPLRYADPNEIKNLFTPLVSRNSIIQAYAPTNTLIVTDAHSNIKRLLNILKTIDITGVGQQIAIIPVENASAPKLVTLLQNVFKGGAKGKAPTTTKDITFVADERTNVIVMIASEGDVDNVRELVKSLDKETPKGQGNINVYYLEHASAEDLAKVLMDIPQKSAETKKE
ncbi:MAG: secretin N-terminal domain-containing protein, partial [Desulfatitalea sp.]